MKIRFNTVLAVSAATSFALAGCAPMADYELGRKAQNEGDYVTAGEHLHRLATMGFPDAQVNYGDLLRDRDSPDAEKRAETWYSRAAEQGSVRAYARLGKLYASRVEEGFIGLAPRAQKFLRYAVESGETDALSDLVELYAIAGEEMELTEQELAKLINWVDRYDEPQAKYAGAVYYRVTGQLPQKAADVVKLCKAVLEEMPRCYLEIASAYYAAPQVGDFEAWQEEIKQAYRKGDLEDEDLLRVVRWLAHSERNMPEDAFAMLALIENETARTAYQRARLLYEYPNLGNQEQLMDAIAALRERGRPEAALLEGRLYYDGDVVTADPHKAEQLFLSVRDELPSADYFLGQMYWQGYLGKADPERALEHLLTAARRGYDNADRVLAEMFSTGEGVVPNPVYALSFAQLAATARPTERNQTLYQSLQQSTSAAERQQAEALLAAELDERRRIKLGENQLIGSTQ